MKSALWIVVFLVGLLIGGVIGFFARPPGAATAQQPQGLRVSVVNNTPDELKNIEVHYRGGSVYTDRLTPGANFSRMIDPTGPSELEIAYADPGGKDVCEELKANLTSGSSGQVRISVLPEGKLKIESPYLAPQE